MDADLERINAVEAQKVSRWCSDNGVESTADLAFFFLSYEEALGTAGRAVADAWTKSRAAVAPGLAVGVRGAVRVAQAAQPSSVPGVSPPPVVLRPSASAPSKVPRGGVLPGSAYLRGDEGQVPVEGESQLFAIMLAASPHRPSSVGEQSALRSFVIEVAKKAEPVTLKNAIRTWQELRSFASALKVDVATITALQLATFIQQNETTTRAYNSLHWMVKNLKLPFDVSLVTKQSKRAHPSKFGTGAKQAPVFPPVAIHELENVMDRMAGHVKWTVLFAAHCMLFGVVRYAHIQRSVIRSITDVAINFWCYKGKQVASRQGFFWAAPRLTINGVDLWPLLVDQLQHVADRKKIKLEDLKGVCFDLEEMQPLSISGFLQVLRYFLNHILEDPDSLTSYSLRRVAPTWATLAQLSEVDKLALGNWVDQGVSVGQTPARYSAAKLRSSTLLKLCLLGAAQNFSWKVSWKDVSHDEVQRQLLVDKPAMDTLMAQADEEILTSNLPSPDDLALKLKPTFISSAKKRLVAIRNRANVPTPQDEEVPLPLEEPGRDAGADEIYDFLARERWSRPGHSGRPEPFTVIFQGENMGNIWLGGLPTQSDAEFLERQKIFLIVSAMRETAKECGGLQHRKFHQMSVEVGYNGAERQASWEDARMVALSTLQSGESILFHCRAGVHRGPVLAAMAMAWINRTDFDSALGSIGEVRAIEPDQVVTRRGGDQIFDWARKQALRDLPGMKLPRAWSWRASSRSGSLWHVVPLDGDSGPLCKAKNMFKGQTVACSATLEALGYDRQICRVCALLRPASEWGWGSKPNASGGSKPNAEC